MEIVRLFARGIPSALLLLTLAACDSSTTGADSGVAPGADAEVVTFAETLAAVGTVELAADLGTLQIHPVAAFDGANLWLSVTVRDGDSLRVFIRRLEQDGTLGPAIPVDDQTAPSDTDAALAINGETLLVAWQRDPGGGVPIETWVRAFDLSGAPKGPSARVETTREGAPLDGIHWFADVIAGADGGFTLVGSRGVEAASAFQIYVQSIDADGALVGDTIEPAPADNVTQTTPSAALGSDGLHLAWHSSPLDEAERGAYLAPGGSPVDLGGTTIRSSYPTVGRVGDHVLAAYGAGTSAFVVDPAGGEPVQLGSGGAPFMTQGAVLWVEGLSGSSGSGMRARTISYDGSEIRLGAPVAVPNDLRVPSVYRPGLTPLGGGRYLAVWTEREGDLYQGRGVVLTLPAP